MTDLLLTAIVSDDWEYILFNHIESMNKQRDAEEEIVDKLKDDLVIKVRTVSGKEYDMSVRLLMDRLAVKYELDEMWDIIFDNWTRINT